MWKCRDRDTKDDALQRSTLGENSTQTWDGGNLEAFLKGRKPTLRPNEYLERNKQESF